MKLVIGLIAAKEVEWRRIKTNSLLLAGPYFARNF